jgi:hypothetical protein
MTVTKKGKPAKQALPNSFQRKFPFTSIENILAELNQLEQTTRPSDGTKSALGKDKKAQLALELAGRLVSAVAGWAVDHQLGLAHKGLAPVYQTKEPSPQKRYLAAQLAKVDKHDHEIAGATLPPRLSPTVARRALLNLLDADPGAFTPRLTIPVRRALRALDYNEVLPIFQPLKAKRKVSLSKLGKQKMAVLFVEHRVARGMKRSDAIDVVAKAFQVGDETLRSWKIRLRKEFGPLEMESSIAEAKDAEGPASLMLYGDETMNAVAKSYVKLNGPGGA